LSPGGVSARRRTLGAGSKRQGPRQRLGFDRRESGTNRFILPPPCFDPGRIRRRSGKKGLNGLAPAAIEVAIDKAVQFYFAHRGAVSAHDALI
jgi:hypothetical protein